MKTSIGASRFLYEATNTLWSRFLVSQFGVLTISSLASSLTFYPVCPEIAPMRGVAACAFLLLLTYASVLRAQSTNASITGQVIDESYALIVDAKIVAVSSSTNARYETTTNDAGGYYLTNLPPGSYRIEIEKRGFKKLIKPGVILHVQDALKIDFEMTIGPLNEIVTVETG